MRNAQHAHLNHLMYSVLDIACECGCYGIRQRGYSYRFRHILLTLQQLASMAARNKTLALIDSGL